MFTKDQLIVFLVFVIILLCILLCLCIGVLYFRYWLELPPQAEMRTEAMIAPSAAEFQADRIDGMPIMLIRNKADQIGILPLDLDRGHPEVKP